MFPFGMDFSRPVRFEEEKIPFSNEWMLGRAATAKMAEGCSQRWDEQGTQLWGDEGVVGLGCDFVDELGKQLQLAAAFPCLSQSIQCWTKGKVPVGIGSGLKFRVL